MRDLQLLVTDGKTFFHEEKRHLLSKTERLSSNVLGYRIINSDPEGPYSIQKEIITNPHQACVVQRTRLSGDSQFLSTLKLYALCAPHLDVGGMGNNGFVMVAVGCEILVAVKNNT